MQDPEINLSEECKGPARDASRKEPSVLRLLAGYLLACVSASITVAIFLLIASAITDEKLPKFSDVEDLTMVAIIGSVIACIFGLPASIVSLVVYRNFIRRSRLALLCLGVFSALTTFILFFGIGTDPGNLATMLLSTDGLTTVALFFPAGLTGAYIFGAVGLGYGFRNWPIGWI